MSNITFENLCEKHRKSVIDILNYYILFSTAAFRNEEVSYEFYDNFLDKDNVYIAYAILNDDKEVIGFCMLEKFKNIPPFLKTAEIMYFIRNEYVGKGIGKEILKKLENDAREYKISKLIVDITDDNEISIRFHERNGFLRYGHLTNCWNKFGKELGIIYMDKNI